MWNGFFDLRDLSDQILKNLFIDALKYPHPERQNHIDVLKGWQRVRESVEKEDIIDFIEYHVHRESHPVVVDRREYYKFNNNHDDFAELGAYTFDTNKYLFLYTTREGLYKLVEDYGLTKKII